MIIINFNKKGEDSPKPMMGATEREREYYGKYKY